MYRTGHVMTFTVARDITHQHFVCWPGRLRSHISACESPLLPSLCNHWPPPPSNTVSINHMQQRTDSSGNGKQKNSEKMPRGTTSHLQYYIVTSSPDILYKIVMALLYPRFFGGCSALATLEAAGNVPLLWCACSAYLRHLAEKCCISFLKQYQNMFNGYTLIHWTDK